jgi:hypothetical protein
MRDLLPDFVRETIRDRYITGVADAEAGFDHGSAEEDSLTGALGHAISTRHPISQAVGDETFVWEIYYRKLRGRGPGAPEKKYGADGVFQIEVSDGDGRLLRRKGLPFQAKKGWSAADRDLVSQTRAMVDTTGDGIVIDYTRHGYTSCPASAVIEAGGRKSAASKAGAISPLGQVLGNEFLDCTVGKEGLFFDPEDETFKQALIDRPLPGHLFTTSVYRLSTRS